jgi:hypothetical protein
MYDTTFHRKIAKDARKLEYESIDNDKRNGTYATVEQDPFPDNTVKKISGYEKEYLKQVPVITGSGRHNMEMEDVVMKQKRPRKPRVPKVGLMIQEQKDYYVKGAGGTFDDSENEEIERTDMRRAMGAGMVANQNDLDADAKMNQLKTKMGGAKKQVQQVVEGSSMPLPVKSRGKKPEPMKEEPKSGGSMSRRAQKIKELMKSKQMTMIQASKYIKENKISY